MSDKDPVNDRTLVNPQAQVDGFGQGQGELQAGQIIGGHYKIKSVVGRGGMGVVYCAEHMVIHRDCALKALAPDRVTESNWRRFEAEARAIARLDHPNIVKVYDMGIDASHSLYYVMDLLQGVSLSQMIRKRRTIPAAEIFEIFAQICSGLGYAHRQGLIHRDVKPSNIILCPPLPGQSKYLVKIIDYGLVKLTGEGNRVMQGQTATGQVCGSPLYMSPEQCIGGTIDERSDIYSLGCTLFECLTGVPPLIGENALETVMMHQKEVPPRMNELRPDKNFPESLERVVGRMLEKIPAQRQQSMEHVAHDLLRVKEGKPVSRTAVNLDQGLLEPDEADEAEEEVQEEVKKPISVAFVCSLGALACVIIVGLVVGGNYLHLALAKKQQTDALAQEVAMPALTPEAARARKAYANFPQISHGVVVDSSGVPVRLFKFPEEPVGFIYAGPYESQKQLASGEIAFPPEQRLTLQLSRPQGEGARLCPEILTKIGPEDIYKLAVPEPQTQLGDTLLLNGLSPALIRSVKGWTGLHSLDFYHCSLDKDAVLALNKLHPMDELRLRDASIHATDLAQVKWLKQLKLLEVKGIDDIDLVLGHMAGSTTLEALCIDETEPSKEALLGLTTCPNLKVISYEFLSSKHVPVAEGHFNIEGNMSDAMVALLCQNHNLEALGIRGFAVTPKSVDDFCRLKKLRLLAVESISPEDSARLKARLPRCKVAVGGRIVL